MNLSTVLSVLSGAVSEEHLVLGECASFIREKMSDLTELFTNR